MANVSALPSAMQQHRTELQQGEESSTISGVVKPQEPSAGAKPATPATEQPAKPADGEKVTISREEFNELQAAAGRVRAAEGRASAVKDDLEALTARLTELEKGSKAIPQAAGSPSAAFNPEKIEYTTEEQEEYGESKQFVRKVALEVLNEKIPALLEELAGKIGEVRSLAEGASQSAAAVRSNTYTERVKEQVPYFDECVGHKYWADFLQATDPDTGDTWEELITRNFRKENVPGMVRVFKAFKEKFGVGSQAVSGYEGALPNNGSATQLPTSSEPEVLKFSERKEAHRKFINKEMDFQEYSKIKEKFDKADAEGRVDYEK